MTSGAASLPVPGDDRAGRDLPGPEALRIALHPAELPLARPRDVAQAAARVSDLISAGRLREARRLAAEFRRRTARPSAMESCCVMWGRRSAGIQLSMWTSRSRSSAAESLVPVKSHATW